MPQPGETVLLSATLLAIFGITPATHSCEVQVLDADGVEVIAKTAMVNVTDTIYSYKWDTPEALPEGPYHILYWAVLDSVPAAPIAEVIDIETVGISASTIATIEEIALMNSKNYKKTWQYDSQGRTTKVTVYFSSTDPFTSPEAIFEHTFSYNVDNSLSDFTVIRIV